LEQAGGKATGFSVSAIDANDNQIWRQAMLHPFVDADQNHVGGLVICDHQNSSHPPSSDPVACSVTPERLHQALAHIRTQTDRIYGLESLVGTSPFSNRLRRQVKTAIESAADLLIIGPGGSGKEHLARTIHAARHGKDGAEMLPFHCSIADQQLIQHNIKDVVASRTQSGFRPNVNQQDWLLLLDVDLLGEAAQNEILGFFQLPNFPLRTIATASTSLIELANQGSYSLELAYHLSIMTIELAPLVERLLDVPFLAQALLERDNFRRDKQMSGFSKSAMQQLIEFHWPENIDQLNRTIQAASRHATSALVTEADLPDDFRHALNALRIGENRETEIQLDDYLGQIEKELISRAIRQAKNNKTKAAKLLGISRPKLLRRLQHFELDSPDAESTDSGESDQLDSSAFMELD
jgi:DNA-binding NtrC family response regulator